MKYGALPQWRGKGGCWGSGSTRGGGGGGHCNINAVSMLVNDLLKITLSKD